MESGRIIDVDGAAAGKDRAKSVGIENVAKFRPMQEIRARGVTPGHISPTCRERIVLEEEMIFPFVVNEPVGVVCPTDLRRKMELRTVFLIISGVDDVPTLQSLRGDRSPESARTYLRNKGEILERYKEAVFKLGLMIKEV